MPLAVGTSTLQLALDKSTVELASRLSPLQLFLVFRWSFCTISQNPPRSEQVEIYRVMEQETNQWFPE